MDDIEKVARALCRADPEIRMGDADGVVEQRVNIAWVHYVGTAQAAIAAMQPAPQEPVAWMYTHPDDPFPPSVRTDRHDKYDFAAMAKRGWIEHALGIIPTPPAGGSDAE